MRKRILFFLFFCLILCPGALAQEGMQLEKVTVVSRHSVRAPLERYLQDLDRLVPQGKTWNRWSVEGSHLTLKGAALETLLGEYFRLWFAQKNFELTPSDIYFGASSKQRTVATARCFASGMLPLMTIPIDYKTTQDGSVGYLDPDYLPLLNAHSTAQFDTTAFVSEAHRELAGMISTPSYDFLEKILNYKHSLFAQERNYPHFYNDSNIKLDFIDSKGNYLEPNMTGDLNLANKASDAFILMYYESKGPKARAFGKKLSFEDWKKLASIKDHHDEILFTAPIIAANVSHCLLVKVYSELQNSQHKFSFLCTHDSSILSSLTTLRVKDYSLPETIEGKVPIGSKFLIESWIDSQGERFIRTRLVYQSSRQIREMEALDLANPPMSVDLSFEGLEKTPEGMYRYQDFMQHFQTALKAYEATAQGRNPFE